MTDRREQTSSGAGANGEPRNEFAACRNLISDRQDHTAAPRRLQAAIQEGLESGMSDKTLRKAWTPANWRHQSRSTLVKASIAVFD